MAISSFNTDLRRITSSHTIALNRFLDRESLKPHVQHVLGDVDYNYLSKIDGEQSIIDHLSSSQSVQYDIYYLVMNLSTRGITS